MNTSSKKRKLLPVIIVLAVIAVGGIAGFLIAPAIAKPQVRNYTISARQYAYTPEKIWVNRGDEIHLKFVSEDVVHGFYLEGHDINVTIIPMEQEVELIRPSNPDKMEKVKEVVFIADVEGKYKYRCSNTCGYLHPFMLGEMIVGPNRLLYASLGMTAGMLIGLLLTLLVDTKQAVNKPELVAENAPA